MMNERIKEPIEQQWSSMELYDSMNGEKTTTINVVTMRAKPTAWVSVGAF